MKILSCLIHAAMEIFNLMIGKVVNQNVFLDTKYNSFFFMKKEHNKNASLNYKNCLLRLPKPNETVLAVRTY